MYATVPLQCRFEGGPFPKAYPFEPSTGLPIQKVPSGRVARVGRRSLHSTSCLTHRTSSPMKHQQQCGFREESNSDERLSYPIMRAGSVGKQTLTRCEGCKTLPLSIEWLLFLQESIGWGGIRNPVHRPDRVDNWKADQQRPRSVRCLPMKVADRQDIPGWIGHGCISEKRSMQGGLLAPSSEAEEGSRYSSLDRNSCGIIFQAPGSPT